MRRSFGCIEVMVMKEVAIAVMKLLAECWLTIPLDGGFAFSPADPAGSQLVSYWDHSPHTPLKIKKGRLSISDERPFLTL